MKKKTLFIFNYKLLHSFLLTPGLHERKTDNSLSVTKHTKHIIGKGRGGGVEISK